MFGIVAFWVDHVYQRKIFMYRRLAKLGTRLGTYKFPLPFGLSKTTSFALLHFVNS